MIKVQNVKGDKAQPNWSVNALMLYIQYRMASIIMKKSRCDLFQIYVHLF